jgi:hypothetical protein
LVTITRDPDMVDKLGTKWYKDRLGSQYADQRLAGATVWLIEELNGRQCFCLVYNNKVIHEDVTIEAMGIAIDQMKDKTQGVIHVNG